MSKNQTPINLEWKVCEGEEGDLMNEISRLDRDGFRAATIRYMAFGIRLANQFGKHKPLDQITIGDLLDPNKFDGEPES